MQRRSIAICAVSTVFVILAAVIAIICVVFVNNNETNDSNIQEAAVGYVSTNSSLDDNSSIVIPWNDLDEYGQATDVQDSDISSAYVGLRATSDDAPSHSHNGPSSIQSQDEVSPLWENIDLSLFDNEEDNAIENDPSSDLDGPLAEFRSITNLTSTTFTTSQTTNKCTPNNQSLLRLILKTDNYPYETSWEILRIINTVTQQSITIGSGPPANTNYERTSNYIGDFCLNPGAYIFRIKDKSATGDGICCEWGLGSYTLDLNGERIVTSSDENFTVRNYNFFVDQAIIQNDIVDPIVIAETSRPTTANPTSAPSPNPTTRRPTPNPTTANPTTRRPTSDPAPRPTNQPTPQPTQPILPTMISTRNNLCQSTFYEIEEDWISLVDFMSSDEEKAHQLGGVVRLAAHDFMDFNRNSNNRYGPDGCFDPTHAANAGLESIWCDSCPLKMLHESKYAFMSRADFWIAASCGVIHHTSGGELDLIDTFRWGRSDRDTCQGSGERLPAPTGCDNIEETFIDRMGLTYADAVALMGGHTLGRGDTDFSGHNGIWVANNQEAQKFDKTYYEQIFLNAWRPRTKDWGSKQDWTTGRDSSDESGRVMLNTDICLVYDIEDYMDDEDKCCTRTDQTYANGENKCVDREAARERCPMYSANNPRFAMRQAVGNMLGGSPPNANNAPFYAAFETAWEKATRVGQTNLKVLDENC